MKDAAIHILKRLTEHGYESYFVGGCVRDMLLGRKVKDFDIATSANTKQVVALFKNKNFSERDEYKVIPVGIQFGVVRIRYQGNEFEVATFREDGQYKDGRRPEKVHFSTASADVLRRDFTINGLLFDPLSEKIIDYVQGQEDLNQKILRTIGDPFKRFGEDKLRLMRALRLACQLDFNIESHTWEVICQMSQQISVVSCERIMEELSKMFSHSAPLKGFKMLRKSGLLKAILLENCPTNESLDFAEKIIPLLKPDLDLILATLFYSYNSLPYSNLKNSKIFQILHSLKFKHSICKKVALINYLQPTLETLLSQSLAQFKRIVRQEYFEEALKLYQVVLQAKGESLLTVEKIQKKANEVKASLNPAPLLTGEDLIELGFKPGTSFRHILNNLEEEQLNESLSTKEEALKWLHLHYPNPEELA